MDALTKVVRCSTIVILRPYEQYEFSLLKNQLLIEERGIGFEDVIYVIEDGYLLKIVNHHNHVKYPKQQFLLVNIENYVYTIPFVVKDISTLFLKTIFRSRKLTKKYLNNEEGCV